MVGMMVATYLALEGVALYATAFAINFAVSTIVTRMFSDNPEGQQDMGVRQQVPPSAANAIPVVYGEAYMGGTFVDAVLTTDQKKMYYVLAISSISPDGTFTFDQTDMYYGDQKITFASEPGKVASLSDEATPTPNVNTKIAGNLFIYLFTSNQAGTITPINSSGSLPSTIMGGSDIQASQRWTGTRQMNGLAFAIVVLNYNREADTTALQPITFHVNHTLRGTGVAKPGDVWYDYITNDTYGGAVDPSFVDANSRTTLNAYSDEIITFTDYNGNPATQARYRMNGVLDAGQTVLSNLDRIMSCSDSWMTYSAALGKWAVVVNKPETTAYAFNDNNIIGEIRVSATDITSSINQVEARFPFKETRDQAAFVNLDLQILNPSLLYPNEPVNKYSVTYDLVNESVQANYLANRLLEQAREDLIVSFSTTYYGIQVDAGDVVSVTNADYGWSAKLFRVMKVNEASLPDGSLGAKLEMSEYSAAVYDNANITQYSPVPNSGLPSVSYFSALSAPTVTGFPSVAVPYFNVQVYIPATGRVTFGNLFYTTSATPTSADWKLLDTASTSNSQPVANGTFYTFSNQSLSSGTYYFAYLVGNDVSQSILSPISASFVWSPVANTGPFVDISGFTGFTKNSAGTVITPSTTVLTAVVQNVTSPTYAWAITGATPTTGSASTITITPSLASATVVATLTVNGSNLTSAIVRTITMPITVDGSTGTNGAIGLAAITAYKVQSQSTAQPTFTTPTSGSAAPSGWYLTLNAALTAAGLASMTPGYVVWYLQGQYNANAFTSGGIPATSTAWTGPVAASVFQDLRSDNWNGSTPPTFGTPATYGTQGYYIRQGNTVGSPSAIYINQGIFSGDISTAGDAIFRGQNLSTDTVIVNGQVYYIDFSAYAEAITTPTLNAMRVGFYGYASASPNLSPPPPTRVAYNVGVLGEGKNKFGSKGYGVVGLGDEVGGYFEGAGYGVIANGNGIVPVGIAIAGKLNWGIYSYPVPTGDTTTFLRNDGTWAVPAGGGGSGTVTSVATSGTVSGITLTGGPITTSGTITLGGTLSAAASSITSGIIATARLGSGTADSTTFLRGDGSWEIPSGGGSGTVTSVSGTGTVSGLTLSGTVTTSGSLTLGGTLSVAASAITSGTIATARLGSGTANTTTFLRGDNTWSASTNNFGMVPSSGTSYSNTFSFFTGGTGITITGNGIDRMTFDTTSDARLKYDIDFDNEDYKTVIPALQIAKYKRNDKRDYKPEDYIEHGTTAQSAETICSYLVNLTDHQNPDSIKAVNYQSIFSMNVKYTQYLQEQVDLLKAEIELLKARIT